MTVETKRGTQMGSICGGGTPTRMRGNAVGGGNSYFMLGVGGCNYDASTGSHIYSRLEIRRVTSPVKNF
jgi:hypothetical protein